MSKKLTSIGHHIWAKKPPKYKVLALTAGAIPIVAQTQADLIETWIEYRDRSHRACRKDNTRDGPRMAVGNGTE